MRRMRIFQEFFDKKVLPAQTIEYEGGDTEFSCAYYLLPTTGGRY